MKYRGDIGPEEYAAMEDGYEQGVAVGFAGAAASLTQAVKTLRDRGGTRVTVDGQVTEIRVLMFRYAHGAEEPVLTLDNVALLIAALGEAR